MDAIISFFAGIAEAVSGAFAFLGGLILDLVYLVRLTGKVLSAIPAFFAWLPGPVLYPVLTAITVAVLYKVLGRD